MCAPLENIKGKTAKEILNQYYTGEKFPLDLGILLKNIGILSKDYDFAMAGKIEGEKVLGAVVSNEKNAVIFYDRYSSYNRQRFTSSFHNSYSRLYFSCNSSTFSYNKVFV